MHVKFQCMGKKSSIFCILIGLCISLQGQSWKSELDSIKLVLTTNLSDKERVNTLLDASALLSTIKPGDALEYAIEAYDLARKTNYKSGIVRSMLNQCDFYSIIGEYDVSLEMAYDALKIADSASLKSYCHNRIATIHAGMKNHKETLYHNKRALFYSSEMGDSNGIVVDLHNIGTTYIELEQYDSALYYLRFTNNYDIRHRGLPDPYSLTNIGSVFHALGEYDSALNYHLQAYYFDLESDEKMLMAIDQQYIALTYLEMGNYDEARNYALQSIEIAKENESFDLEYENYSTLYKIYEKERNYKKAFEYAMLYNTARDTLFKRSKQSLVLNLETKHRVKEQQEKVQLLEKQKNLINEQKDLLSKKNKLFLISMLLSILFFLSTIVIVILVYRRQRMYQELSKELQLANDSKERMLSIIGHDLRGSVGTLKSAAATILECLDDIEDVRELLESFYPVADSTYDLLENLLTWAKCNQEKIEPNIEELNLKEIVAKAITHTQHQASAKSVEIISNVHEVVVNADQNMLLSVFRNILGNSIKFSHSRSKVLISGEKNVDRYIISIADNGVGMDKKTLFKLFHSQEIIHSAGTLGERGSGLGLMICKTFLESMDSRIWAESTLTKGTTFNISLPYKAHS